MTATLAPTTHWSTAGADTGWPDSPANRPAITAAASQLDWTDQPHHVRQLQQPSVRALSAAIFAGRLDQLHDAAASAVEIDGTNRTLVGLADDHNRYYLLDLGDAAVYVLHETQVQP